MEFRQRSLSRVFQRRDLSTKYTVDHRSIGAGTISCRGANDRRIVGALTEPDCHCRNSRPSFEQIAVTYLQGGDGFPRPNDSRLRSWRIDGWKLGEGARAAIRLLYDLLRWTLSASVGRGESRRRHSSILSFWFRQCRAMIQLIPGSDIGVIGHSISGALAFKLAAREPRVTKVLTTGCMGAPFTINEDTIRTWTFPRGDKALVRRARG